MDYIDSYYSQFHKHQVDPWPSLHSDNSSDCCIIGGGIAGLSVARDLLDQGLTVTILEANRIGWGASGRNGGFVAPGYALSYTCLKQQLGKDHANKLYRLSVEGVSLLRDNIRRFQMQEVLQSESHLDVVRYNNPQAMQNWVAESNRDFDTDRRFIDREKLQTGLGTERYHAGVLQADAFQIHPLNYCLQLAQSIDTDKGFIFEKTEALSIKQNPDKSHSVKTAFGSIQCSHVIHCSSAYTGTLVPALKKSILPVSTHVVLTQPVKAIGKSVMQDFSAVLDNRRASDYFRVVEGNRFLWGGSITTIEPSHRRLINSLQARIHHVFPQLKPVEIELGWNGLMGYTRHQMPLVGKLGDNQWVCTAFGGHGLNSSTICARLVARAIADNDQRYRLFEPYRPVWNFGKAGQAGVQLSYWGYQLADWFDENLRYR